MGNIKSRKIRIGEITPKTNKCSKTGCRKKIGKKEGSNWLIYVGSYNNAKVNLWFCPSCEDERRRKTGKKRAGEATGEHSKDKRIKKIRKIVCGMPNCNRKVATIKLGEITITDLQSIRRTHYGIICKKCKKELEKKKKQQN